jgi:hypothetical protein
MNRKVDMETQETPKCIEAQEFVIRDKNGVVRARLGVTSSWEEPYLLLCNRKGVPLISIELQNDKPCMGFMRPDGNPLFSFKQLDDGSTILGLSRNNKMPALRIVVEDGKDVQVELCRCDGEPVRVHFGDSGIG